ncbi:MAG: DUF1810 domain-containing protein [Bacilli bacterium]|nr:DUF1810 domain-containing protein [Bacilli bacterium]
MSNISRFIKAQNKVYDTVIQELKNGHKETHWIWFIFPQVAGLGHSFEADFFGIDSIEDAKEYFDDELLRTRYLECCSILLNLKESDPLKIMGSNIDAIKLRSSLTLFIEITDNPLIKATLQKLYNGEKCQKTLDMLHNEMKK